MIYLTRNNLPKSATHHLLLASLFFFIPHLNAVIIHSDTLHATFDHLIENDKKDETLIVLDIDNTLAEPDTTHGFGSDQWFRALVKSYELQSQTTQAAINTTLPLYFAIHQHYPLRTVETTTSSCVKDLQEKAQVMSLTARSPELSTRTCEQLNTIDIHLEEKPIHPKELNLKLTHDALYRNGILFGSNNNKGDLLVHFLETINYTPKKIIFVDDSESNISRVHTALQNKGIEVICIHHHGLDDKVKSFDLASTREQEKEFSLKHAQTIAQYQTALVK